MDRIVLSRDKYGTIEACLQEDRQHGDLCVQLTSETEDSPDRPVLEEQEIYLSAQEMDRLVNWWQEIRRAG